MKYFEIKQETDSKIIGKYPQVKELKIGFHEARASQWGIISKWKSEDDIPDLNNFVLHNNSRLSDCVSNNFVITSSGLFLSEKCSQILETFTINGSFHPMTIFRRGTPHPYRFLWYEYGATSKIDFKKSEFIEYNDIYEKSGAIIAVDDFEDYKAKFRILFDGIEDEAGWDLKSKSLKIAGCFDVTPAFGIGLICNEKVKNAIEENKLTGFDFRPIDTEILFD
ncbi:hypothetical protein [Flavobacterium sp. CAU 1735]|uniref:hypothetical protein n=1 Tax=Flavobacterium sp. CAU 1735 TaxID=3140361 RepID=UPI0032612EA2